MARVASVKFNRHTHSIKHRVIYISPILALGLAIYRAPHAQEPSFLIGEIKPGHSAELFSYKVVTRLATLRPIKVARFLKLEAG